MSMLFDMDMCTDVWVDISSFNKPHRAECVYLIRTDSKHTRFLRNRRDGMAAPCARDILYLNQKNVGLVNGRLLMKTSYDLGTSCFYSNY